jgi:hypothetical protein
MPPGEPAAAQPGGAAPAQPAGPGPSPQAATPAATQALIEQAARDLADYQRLTAEGKLGEAGQKLEAVKRALEQLRPPPPKK